MAKLRKASVELLKTLVKESTSFSQVQVKLNMSGGGSFKTLKNKILSLGLDISHFTGQTWNKGKTRETSESVNQGAKKCSESTLGKKGTPHTSESREKLSKSASERSWTNGLIKTKWFSIFNPSLQIEVQVQGTWELKYAEWLNQNNVAWIKNKQKSFKWKKPEEDHFRHYHPDFYLPETDQYIEVKGFMWKSKDGKTDYEVKLKFVQEQNPDLKLKILMKKDLTELGIKMK
jgi:hypothetical protein